VVHIDIPELRQPDETPMAYGSRVATMKAQAGLIALAHAPDVLVLGADTEVVLDDIVFGKPSDASEACDMLMRLSGRVHEVITAVTVMTYGNQHRFCQRSAVAFKTLSDAEIHQYVATGEAFGKAGAYAIQGIASCFVERLEGSFSGVMGLPVFETQQVLNQFGLRANWQTSYSGSKSNAQ
jgi:septum formation protein